MYTKGPWSVVSYLDEHDRRGRNVLVTDDTPGAKHRVHAPNFCVAYTVPNLDDARLIALAPEMVEALRALLNRLDTITTEEFSISGERVERENARALLARVDGD